MSVKAQFFNTVNFLSRTAKSRQKQEKKKWSLREGSPYEEEALVEVLHKMASQAEKWKGKLHPYRLYVVSVVGLRVLSVLRRLI